MFTRRKANTSSSMGNGTNSHPPKPKEKIHWKVPSLMILSLILGTTLAVGNHLFHKSLNGQTVGSQNQQTWNGRYSVAFAFLVKLFLSTTVSIACVQNLWWVLRSKSVTLGTMDSMFGILENALSLANFRVWFRGPTVAILALGVWVIIPLCAISPPSTVTVHASVSNSSQMVKVPNLDFMVDHFALGGTTSLGTYAGPAPDLERLVLAVTAQGSILNLTDAAPCSDCSYSLEFYGPALKCAELNATMAAQIRADLLSAYSESLNESDSPLYAAFVPWGQAGYPEFANMTNNTLYGIKALYNNNPLLLDLASTDYAKTYINYNYTHNLECGLYNASYEVEFDFNNGVQSTNTKSFTYLNGVAASQESPDDVLRFYNSSGYDQGELASFKILSYQAVMEAMNSILVGHIENTMYNGIVSSETKILSTVLATTADLQPILTTANQLSVSVNTPPTTSNSNYSLSDAIAEMSRNVTMSLFSSGLYLQGSISRSSDYPGVVSNATNTSVTYRIPENVYVYAPRDLLISWGCAILFALFAILLGLTSLIKNGSSYSNNFSTVLRTTRNSDIDTVVHAAATSGSDPLPKILADQKLSLRTSIDSSGEPYTAIHVVGGPQVYQNANGMDTEKGSGREMRKRATGNVEERSFGEEVSSDGTLGNGR